MVEIEEDTVYRVMDGSKLISHHLTLEDAEKSKELHEREPKPISFWQEEREVSDEEAQWLLDSACEKDPIYFDTPVGTKVFEYRDRKDKEDMRGKPYYNHIMAGQV